MSKGFVARPSDIVALGVRIPRSSLRAHGTRAQGSIGPQVLTDKGPRTPGAQGLQALGPAAQGCKKWWPQELQLIICIEQNLSIDLQVG